MVLRALLQFTPHENFSQLLDISTATVSGGEVYAAACGCSENLQKVAEVTEVTVLSSTQLRTHGVTVIVTVAVADGAEVPSPRV